MRHYLSRFFLLSLSACNIENGNFNEVEGRSEELVEGDQQIEVNSQLDEFDQDIINRVISKEHETDKFIKINSEPYNTSLNNTQTIEVYVDADNAESYKNIDPDNSNSFEELREGAFIVREVWEDDVFIKYTIMIKREAGYFPDSGDYYYAVFDAVGNVEESDDGNLVKGALDNCAVCHIPRINDGYLFGVPEVYQDELRY